jgi:hypothetical protein
LVAHEGECTDECEIFAHEGGDDKEAEEEEGDKEGEGEEEEEVEVEEVIE